MVVSFLQENENGGGDNSEEGDNIAKLLIDFLVYYGRNFDF